MMKIKFDLDGVLVREETEKWIAYFEQTTGRRFNRQRFAKTHNWSDALGLPAKLLEDLYVKQYLSLTDSTIHPITGAVSAVKTLRQLGSSHLVTARDQRLEIITTEQVTLHFGAFDSYAFGHVDSKVEAVKALGNGVLIEDSAYQAQLVAESGIPVIFFPQPRSLEHLRHHRHPQVIYPAAAKELVEDMTAADLDNLHQQTWQEIIAICQELASKPRILT